MPFAQLQTQPIFKGSFKVGNCRIAFILVTVTHRLIVVAVRKVTSYMYQADSEHVR